MILALIISTLVCCTKEKVAIEEEIEPVPVSYCDSLKALGQVSYQCDIDTIITTHCGRDLNGCHSATAGNPDLSTFNGVKAKGDDGRLVARAVDGSPSFMPPAGAIPDSLRQKIKTWVDAGALDN